jgi:outer membrane protein assembly factor BamD (BamD/ComL family)
MYINRMADEQITHVINDMARPGYVLVSRQMGKTNLLLHTKDTMQDATHVFVYIDFSTMSGYDEKECLNTIIDTAIETNLDIFAEAEQQINNLRSSSSYSAIRMYNRELRILLKYVEQIVFIMDEIDALTRTPYSDRIFSIIRGHYFAWTNFPELKKATYILSGVIEPKDIIKDPNISPFNIGEKIYLSDFTKSEFLQLVSKSEYLSTCDSSIVDRLYYWTKGQPRMSWDLCCAAEDVNVQSVNDVDRIVEKMYLTSFDRAPIDSIRDRVKTDSILRDALIQLAIDKGDTLSQDVRNKLYLAGVINFDQSTQGFKNPILAQSLSYKWLLSIYDQELNYLNVATDSIYLEKDYKKAISNLSQFLESNPTDIAEIDKAHFLMGQACFRSYRTELCLKHLGAIVERGPQTPYYYKGLLLQAEAYATNEQFTEAITGFKKIIKDIDAKDNDEYYNAILGLVGLYIEQNDTRLWKESEDLIKEHLPIGEANMNNVHFITIMLYYLAQIESQRGNREESVGYIDDALRLSQLNERPWLLYAKIQNLTGTNKDDAAKELFESLQGIKNKPELEDFDNKIIGFNLLYAARILSLLMVQYPQFEVAKYLRQFFYDSKENAVIYIYQLISQAKDNIAMEFLCLLLKLVDNNDWNFSQENICQLAIAQINTRNECSVARTYIANIESGMSLHEIVATLFCTIINYYIKNRDFRQARACINIFQKVQPQIDNISAANTLQIRYYDCMVSYYHQEYLKFQDNAASLLNDLNKYKNDDSLLRSIRMQGSTIDKFINSIQSLLLKIQSNKNALSHSMNYPSNINRNEKIKVLNLATNTVFGAKFKQVQNGLDLGIYKFIEIVKD